MDDRSVRCLIERPCVRDFMFCSFASLSNVNWGSRATPSYAAAVTPPLQASGTTVNFFKHNLPNNLRMIGPPLNTMFDHYPVGLI